MTANQINYFKAREEQRAHVATEEIGREGNRINLIRSGIEAQNAATNQLLAQVKQYESVETARANQAREYETQRHNIAMENETLRSNTAMESYRNLSLLESQRAAMANEALTAQRNYETARSNAASEWLEQQRVNETARSNLVSEGQREAQLWGDTQERHTQQYKAEEEARHNREVEAENRYKDTRSLNQGAVREVTNFFSKLASPLVNFLVG